MSTLFVPLTFFARRQPKKEAVHRIVVIYTLWHIHRWPNIGQYALRFVNGIEVGRAPRLKEGRDGHQGVTIGCDKALQVLRAFFS